MVGSALFNFLNQRIQQIIGKQTPIADLHVFLVGDLFQLQPVFDKWIFERPPSDYGILASNIWEEYFQLCELHKIMRQKDDKAFAELLNRLREGSHTNADINVLKTRLI